jgi:hypothetical protein
MKLIKYPLIIGLLLISIASMGQDTVSVYFEFGSTKISESQSETLNAIQTKYDLSDLDSVCFVGVADSVGNYKSNLKLSGKRARNISNYCERLLPTNTSSKIKALGEINNQNVNKNRRVDVVLYFHSAQTKETEETEGADETEAKELSGGSGNKDVCYTIDYALLHRCHTRTIIKGKKQFIVIETTSPTLFKNKKYYSGSRNANGKFITKKIRWEARQTGRKGSLWKQQTMYVATILKKDFDTYKIFKIDEVPCTECSEDFKNTAKISKADSCIQVDRFLMDNLQFKNVFLQQFYINVRVPREYVNTDDHYYIGCGLGKEVKWKTKKGRRKKNYYYSTLPTFFAINGLFLSNITKVMECCKANPEPSECSKPLVSCGKGILEAEIFPFKFNIEIGSHYQQNKMVPYAAIGKCFPLTFGRANFLVGTDINYSLYGSVRFNRNLFVCPLRLLNPAFGWKDVADEYESARWIAKFYIGSELDTRINKRLGNYLEQNIQLGLSVEPDPYSYDYALNPVLFIQYGAGYDYLRFNSKTIYPIVQVGINMNVGLPLLW